MHVHFTMRASIIKKKGKMEAVCFRCELTQIRHVPGSGRKFSSYHVTPITNLFLIRDKLNNASKI